MDACRDRRAAERSGRLRRRVHASAAPCTPTRRIAIPGCGRTRRCSRSCSTSASRCWASAWARSSWSRPRARPRAAAPEPEIGWHDVTLTAEGADDPLLAPLAPGFEAFEWHSYEFGLPAGATPLARSAACLQACRLGEAAWAIQFHAEVTAKDAEAWIDDYRSDEDAVRIGLDPDALRAETRSRDRRLE